MKRFQNISPVTTNVMKRSTGGEHKSITVRPGQIIHVDDEDIQFTRDSYNPPSNNPFDQGWICEIPQGETTHPDCPDFGRNPTISQAAKAFAAGRDETRKMIERIRDQRGLVMVRRALEKERASLGEVQIMGIEQMIDKQSDVVDRIHRENTYKYALKD